MVQHNNTNAESNFQRAMEVMGKVPKKLLIGGEWVESASGLTFANLDPRTGAKLCDVAEATPEDVDRAVMAAKKAFDSGPWPRLPGTERGKVLYRLAELIDQYNEELALLETLDNGKTLTQSREIDVPQSAAHFRYFAGWADKIEGNTIPSAADYTIYTLREPVGVVGQILPWNFPLLMAAWKLAPALCTGNTVVLKASQFTPLSAIRLAQLAEQAGLPAGVINILTGKGSEIGDAITHHPHVDKVAFTGSTSVGRVIGGGAAEGIKPVTLELGGNSPIIVAHDADFEAAVRGCHEALFFNAGEACECGARLFVHDSMYDKFVERSAELAKQRKSGDPFDESVRHGPLVSEKQMAKVLEYIEKGKKEGARLVAGGSRIGEHGYLLEPTVFADVEDGMAISRDEIFGPVQIILKYHDVQTVISRANNTEYGLASAVWTQSLETMQEVTRGIKAGTVWVNTHHIMDASAPFGGYKESGVGREHGHAVLEHYTQTKSVIVPLPKNKSWQIM